MLRSSATSGKDSTILKDPAAGDLTTSTKFSDLQTCNDVGSCGIVWEEVIGCWRELTARAREVLGGYKFGKVRLRVSWRLRWCGKIKYIETVQPGVINNFGAGNRRSTSIIFTKMLIM